MICIYTICTCVCLTALRVFRRYVLISRPTEWSDKLREKFLEGLDAFLELLKCMQVTMETGLRLLSVVLCLCAGYHLVAVLSVIHLYCPIKVELLHQLRA